MKLLIGIIILVVLTGIVVFISYKRKTSFIDDLHIEEPSDKKHIDITQPTRKEVKMYFYASETVLKPLYRSIVELMDLTGREKVMDFGSGPGTSANLIARGLESRGGELTCLDISKNWMEVVKHRLANYDHVNFLLGDITAMELEPEIYDLILVHFVLHDIDKKIRRAILEKIVNILRPGGRLVIREPTSAQHGMPIKEIEELLESTVMHKRYLSERRILLFIPVAEGVFYKQ